MKWLLSIWTKANIREVIKSWGLSEHLPAIFSSLHWVQNSLYNNIMYKIGKVAYTAVCSGNIARVVQVCVRVCLYIYVA